MSYRNIYQITCAVAVATLATCALVRTAECVPFSYSSTSRKSILRSRDGQTVTALTLDSEGLVFQDYVFTDQNGSSQYDPRYMAFVTRDSTVDDNYSLPGKQCTGSTLKQVYWVDDYTNGVACVSKKYGVQGAADSYNPRIGGPEGDEGRYVIFESEAANLFLPKNPGQGTPIQEVVVHDRRADDTFLSTSKCVPNFGPAPLPTRNPGSNRDVELWDISEDAQKMFITTDGDYMRDNVNPLCYGTGVKGPYIRDGSDCFSPSLGECKSNALYDKYGFHADSVLFLDSDARNGAMNSSGTISVFDSLATIPTHFNPDVSGFYDIYLHKSDSFSVISRAQVARCSLSGTLLPLLNNNEPANGNSTRPRIDGPGRYIVFQSDATDLVVDTSNKNMVCKEGSRVYYPHPKDTTYVSTGGKSQVYVYDAVENRVSLISKAFNSTGGGNGDSGNAWISRDGHYIVYESLATNLLQTATTAHKNVFMHDRVQQKTYLVTTGKVSGQSTDSNGLDADATITHVSRNGLVVAFQTRASNVVDATTNGGANNGGVQHVYIAQNSCPLDTDGDAVPDCLDLCPADLLKTEPGSCGCGALETDTDKDLTPDCIDACPNDAAKVVSGQCGCGRSETDTDRDGKADCVDECPNDNSKVAKGLCGCGVTETDTDGDGTPDCKDACPANPNKTSLNGCTCTDLKDKPGTCGCNTPDTDANGNGAADCVDPNVNTQPTTPKVDVTRTTPDSKKAKFQLIALFQRFTGKVTYNVVVRRGSKTVSKTSDRALVSFTGLDKGTVTLEYSVTVGKGTSAVTSKTTTTTVKLPGGIVK